MSSDIVESSQFLIDIDDRATRIPLSHHVHYMIEKVALADPSLANKHLFYHVFFKQWRQELDVDRSFYVLRYIEFHHCPAT